MGTATAVVVEQQMYNVYVDVKDGRGVVKVTKHPVTKEKATDQVGR